MNGYNQRKNKKKNILKFHRNGKTEYKIYGCLADISNSSIYYTYEKKTFTAFLHTIEKRESSL